MVVLITDNTVWFALLVAILALLGEAWIVWRVRKINESINDLFTLYKVIQEQEIVPGSDLEKYWMKKMAEFIYH